MEEGKRASDKKAPPPLEANQLGNFSATSHNHQPLAIEAQPQSPLTINSEQAEVLLQEAAMIQARMVEIAGMLAMAAAASMCEVPANSWTTTTSSGLIGHHGFANSNQLVTKTSNKRRISEDYLEPPPSPVDHVLKGLKGHQSPPRPLATTSSQTEMSLISTSLGSSSPSSGIQSGRRKSGRPGRLAGIEALVHRTPLSPSASSPSSTPLKAINLSPGLRKSTEYNENNSREENDEIMSGSRKDLYFSHNNSPLFMKPVSATASSPDDAAQSKDAAEMITDLESSPQSANNSGPITETSFDFSQQKVLKRRQSFNSTLHRLGPGSSPHPSTSPVQSPVLSWPNVRSLSEAPHSYARAPTPDHMVSTFDQGHQISQSNASNLFSVPIMLGQAWSSDAMDYNDIEADTIRPEQYAPPQMMLTSEQFPEGFKLDYGKDNVDQGPVVPSSASSSSSSCGEIGTPKSESSSSSSSLITRRQSRKRSSPFSSVNDDSEFGGPKVPRFSEKGQIEYNSKSRIRNKTAAKDVAIINDPEAVPYTITTEGLFQCHWCPNAFRRKHDLNRHVISHAGDASKRFECETCHIKFTRRDAMLRHVRANKCFSSEEDAGDDVLVSDKHSAF